MQHCCIFSLTVGGRAKLARFTHALFIHSLDSVRRASTKIKSQQSLTMAKRRQAEQMQQNEALIELVKGYEGLYNYRDPRYRDAEYLRNCREEISEIMVMNGELFYCCNHMVCKLH